MADTKVYTEEEVKRISDAAAIAIDVGYIKKTVEAIEKQMQDFIPKDEVYKMRNDAAGLHMDHENRIRSLERNCWYQSGFAGAIGAGISLLASYLGLHH